jgi:molybdopterin-containing oxidoreductase family membrane subunit
MATTTLSKKSTFATPGVIVALLATAAGIAAWIYQLGSGMRVTGLSQEIAWGAYIAAFFTAVGAGAGLLALAGLAEFIPGLAGVRGRSLALALACFVAGGLFITLDIGAPAQVWRIIAAFRFSSLMTWDFWLLALAALAALVYLFAVRGGGAQKALGALGILAAVAVVAVEGWMLSSLAARPLWGSGLTLATFLVGAAVAGLGVALLAGVPQGEKLRGALLAALALSLALAASEALTGLVGGKPEARLILAGFPAPWFWLHVLAGLAAPIWLLVRKVNLPLAGLLAALGVLAEKVWTLTAGESSRWLDLPPGSYFPTWVELTALIGVIGAAYLVYRAVQAAVKAG